MARHSKWHNIKHRKAAVDKKRGKVWTKCAQAVMVAARNGGPDPASNLTLRYAIDEARYANMPRDTIERAIKKGSGDIGGEQWESVRYEGYGPGGAAIIIEALTNNRTRTAGDLRLAFADHGGNLGASGCVGYMFNQVGEIRVKAAEQGVTEERVMEAAINAGAQDVEPPDPTAPDAEQVWTVVASPTDFHAVKAALEAAKLPIASGDIGWTPTTRVVAAGDNARSLIDLIDAIEDLDDVQKVYSNFDVDEKTLAALEL